ncbi:MAG: DNA translocase FtsK [Bellilinea sp.]|nr:MAG: DNA translocase FtsK [Bellilinea sp.]
MAKQPSNSRKTPAASHSRGRSKAAGSQISRKSGRPSSPAGRSRTAKRNNGSGFTLPSLSLDRKLDLLGVFLAFVGLLTLLSLLSSQRSSITAAWISFLSRLSGWGAFLLPVLFIAVGLWLVFRSFEKLPRFSAERLTGGLLIYLNLLAWMHLIAGGEMELAALGKGGGYVGGFLLRLLTSSVGVAGAIIVLAAWLLIAIVFTFDLSIPELMRQIQPLFSRIQRLLGQTFASKPQSSTEDIEAEELPPDFQPLPPSAPQRSPTPRRERPASSSTTSSISSPAADSQPTASPAENTDPATPRQPSPTAPSVVWELPPVDSILDPATPAAQQTNLEQERAKLIEETLASFGAPAHVVDISRGPTVTRFGVEPDFIETRSGRTRVRVSKIASLADDLALALAAPRIRIQAPVPGRAYVGIEVPNTEISRVSMREVLESDVFKRIRSDLRFAIGKDVAGKPVAVDLAAMPHLLIAGTTGSGKSVCVNSILTCLLLNNTPAEMRLILVDPKRVELTGYNGIPHLLAPVVVDTERVIGALQWLQREMDARYHKFSQSGARNIQDFNARHPAERLPYLVAVIDELADLMMLAPDETERAITRLAQLARATGIHLILATQRPSVDVVTGLIKANFPARIAFAVASSVDSRVILDQPGAERLLGRGDMLFQAPDAAAPVRLQGVFVSDVEIQRLVDFWRTQAAIVREKSGSETSTPATADLLPAGIPLKQTPLWDDEESEGDPLLKEAIDLVRREGRASITMLQRRLRIGYTRAARLIDALEEKGIISPALPNSQVREVLDYGPTAPPAEK